MIHFTLRLETGLIAKLDLVLKSSFLILALISLQFSHVKDKSPSFRAQSSWNFYIQDFREVFFFGGWNSRLPYNVYTGCPRRNWQNFGRVFLMLNYNDITQNTYIQSWTVKEIMAREVWNFDSCYTLIDYQIHIATGRNMWFL